jgi:hypothetical protein
MICLAALLLALPAAAQRAERQRGPAEPSRGVAIGREQSVGGDYGYVTRFGSPYVTGMAGEIPQYYPGLYRPSQRTTPLGFPVYGTAAYFTGLNGVIAPAAPAVVYMERPREGMDRGPERR